MDLSAELMEVVRDLCRFAAAFLATRELVWVDTLIEQCAELLAHRARLAASRPRGRSLHRDLGWMN